MAVGVGKGAMHAHNSSDRACMPAKMSLGGRVSETNAKKLMARQLGDFASGLDNVGFVDCKTGRISGKKLGCSSSAC